jgi:MFS family permease
MCEYATSRILGILTPSLCLVDRWPLTASRLNVTFNIASVTTNISALLVGAILDRYGPRICGLISSGLLLFGSLCMAFAANLPFDAYIAGHFLLALGGTFTFVPSFHLSNAFPQVQGLILALITGAFDASAAVFLVFRLLYESTDGAFGLKQFFLVYLAIPVFIFVCQLILMPAASYQTRMELDHEAEQAKNPANDVHSSDDELETEREVRRVRSARRDQRRRTITEINDLLGTRAERNEHLRREDEKRVTSGVWGALHGLPASKQVRTPWFILITLLTVLQMARMNLFIATIWSQYTYMLDSPLKAERVNEFFDIALPIGGIAAVPFIGLLLDSTSTVVILGLITFLSTTIGILGVLPFLWAAYANVVLFVLFRPLYYSAMS